MPNYKSLYFHLFNQVTEAIERLKEAQQQAEQQYIEEEPTVEVRQIDSHRKSQ